MSFPAPLQRLIEEFRRLPGIGPKSAERLAFHVLEKTPEDVSRLSQILLESVGTLRPCPTCFALAEKDRCLFCQDPRRDSRRICVVSHTRDVFVFERGRIFQGLYHVLEGLISPLDGVGPEDLRIEELLGRLGEVDEVILALNPSAEGESTSVYLADQIAAKGVSVSQIAYGLPVGGELEFVDEVTLARALAGRRDLGV